MTKENGVAFALLDRFTKNGRYFFTSPGFGQYDASGVATFYDCFVDLIIPKNLKFLLFHIPLYVLYVHNSIVCISQRSMYVHNHSKNSKDGGGL